MLCVRCRTRVKWAIGISVVVVVVIVIIVVISCFTKCAQLFYKHKSNSSCEILIQLTKHAYLTLLNQTVYHTRL